MNVLITLLILLVSGLLIVTPPVAVWRSMTRRRPGHAAWIRPMLALVGPVLACLVLVVLVWLPAYSGQCGGWLGETTPCRSFGEYAADTLFWAVLSLAMPGVLGMLLGLVVLIVRLVKPAPEGS